MCQEDSLEPCHQGEGVMCQEGPLVPCHNRRGGGGGVRSLIFFGQQL